jgi:hypothetical protein
MDVKMGKSEQEDQNVGDDDQQREKPERLPADVVMEGNRNHALSILHSATSSAHRICCAPRFSLFHNSGAFLPAVPSGLFWGNAFAALTLTPSVRYTASAGGVRRAMVREPHGHRHFPRSEQ